MKKVICATLLLYIARQPVTAQVNANKVGQLVAAENYFMVLAKEKGFDKAFFKLALDNAVVFRPNPVNGITYYKNNPEKRILNWEPAFAKISKSDDWGFTSGPYIYRDTTQHDAVYYGEYLSVWKKNDKGVWKLALDAGISHKKPVKDPQLTFLNPTGEKFMHQRSEARLQQREDIVFSSDKLYSTILKADNSIAYNEFLTDEVHLLFPGYEPIIGKKAAKTFWAKQGVKLTSEPVKADRAYSGELAFTYGNATTTKNGINTAYNYIRVWELQPGYKWYTILEMYIPVK